MSALLPPADEHAPTAAGERAAPRRYVALDSLRGVAALGVVLFHLGDAGSLARLGFTGSGWLFVDFFFVLSGFVIAASYGGRLASGFSKARFMALRLGRIYPLHFVVLMAFLLAEVAVFRPFIGPSHPWGEFWRGLFLLDGLRMHTGNFFAPVSWSIGVEMVLYVLAATLFGWGRAGVGLAGTLACAAAAAIVLGYNEPWFPFLLQRGLLGFALGAAALALHRRLPRMGARVSTALEVAAVVAVAAMLAATPPGTAIPYAALLFMATTVIFANDGGAVSWVLALRPFVNLGLWSYAVYTTHLFLVVAFNRGLPLAFAATGHGAWINRDAATNWYGLSAIVLPEWAENLVVLALLTAVLAVSAFAFRTIEEPARLWSRRHAARIGRDAAPASAAPSSSAPPFQQDAGGLTAET